MFESLLEAANRGELILIDGGLCVYRVRQDRRLVIHEIISTRPGAGTEMLARLKLIPKIAGILAKCPADLESNKWYQKKGFACISVEKAKSGRELNVYWLPVAWRNNGND